MLQKFWAWVRALFGLVPQKHDDVAAIEQAERDYRDVEEINFAAIFAQKLTNIAFSDSTLEITAADGGERGQRAELVAGVLDWAFRHARKIMTQVLATGGRVLVPYVQDGRLRVSVVAQERMVIVESDGDRILHAAIAADTATIGTDVYYRWVELKLQDGALILRNRASTMYGAQVSLVSVPAWAGFPDEYAIAGVDQLPIAFLRCPADNRRENDLYGAAITYGSEALIREVKDHLRIIAREYRLTRPMLGLDSQLWRTPVSASSANTIAKVRKTVQDGDDPFIPIDGTADGTSAPWMIYAPAIRDSAMFARLTQLFSLLEKSVGTSRGILTERETAAATATEIKTANHDTFTWVSAIRDEWKRGMDDLAYACDVYAEHFGLTPAGARGDYAISFDWDMSLFESSTETFQQLTELQSVGALSRAELRQWVRGGTLEENQAAVDQIAQEEPAQGSGLESLLGGTATGALLEE